MARRFAMAVLGALALVATAAATDLSARLPHHPRTIGFRTARFTVPALRERELCWSVTLPNTRALDVDRITIDLASNGRVTSHHFAMFIVADPNATDLPLVPADNVGCVGVGGAFVSPILAFTQSPRQTIALPAGVAIRLEPHQRLLVNPHYVNAETDAATVDAVVRFRRARPRTVRHRARSFQLGTGNIAVPPGADGAAVAQWTTTFPMNVVALSTHSHKFTRTVDVELVRHGEPQDPILQTDSWSEPAVARYQSPFLRLEPGDGFRWTCNYRNSKSVALSFGITAEDEMCFTTGFYFTDGDAPAPPGCFGDGRGLVCPFN